MERRPATPEEARALANPLRLRILRLCLDRALTNEELAARLGRDAGTVLHHVRLLVETGFLAPDGGAAGHARGDRAAVSGDGQVVDARRGRQSLDDPCVRRRVPRRDRRGAPGGVPWSVRLAVRLRPDAREAFEERLQVLAEELKDADDPAGEPYGFFAGLHRRAGRTASTD